MGSNWKVVYDILLRYMRMVVIRCIGSHSVGAIEGVRELVLSA